MPVLRASAARPSGSLARLTSVNSMPGACSSALDAGAERAWLSACIRSHLTHYFIKYSEDLGAVQGRRDNADGQAWARRAWPDPVKTEAIVLRSMRYGEADRILHLYTPRSADA